MKDETETRVEGILGRIARPPLPWTIALSVIAILFAFDVNDVTGDRVLNFHPGTYSLIALSLIWLPLLIKAFALVGGSFRAVGLEATVNGVVSMADFVELTATAREAAQSENKDERVLASERLAISLNRLLVPTSSDEGAYRRALQTLARSYDRLRVSMPPGSPRTSAMTKLVNEARSWALVAPEDARVETRRMVDSDLAGDRIVALGLIWELSDPQFLPFTLRCIENSMSAFEMYQALLALQEMAPSLSHKQRQQAIEVIELEKTDPRHLRIAADPGLPTLLNRTLAILKGDE